jgi:transposase
MKATTVGIDLAKNLIQVHGVDERGKPVFRKQLKRNQVLSFFANVTPCLIGWRHVAARITGRGSCRSSDIP